MPPSPGKSGRMYKIPLLFCYQWLNFRGQPGVMNYYFPGLAELGSDGRSDECLVVITGHDRDPLVEFHL